MTNGTMHTGGLATGAARFGVACTTLSTYVGTAVPVVAKPWHTTNHQQVSPVFITDRLTRRPLERFP
jgi:hypothetical protein